MVDKNKRDYEKEYKDFHGTEEEKKNRAKRNTARRRMMKKGRVKKGDGKDVDHKQPLSRGGSNNPKNLRVQTRSKNRSNNKKRTTRKK